jgi:glycosyltransferase involved in cell wall biosynthesis
MTLVSVIIPTHDRARFVGGAIETALAQTHTDLEVIVVNDGSTDDTAAVLDTYRDHDGRVRAVSRPVNRGIADGRNHAIDRATGEYVCVLDDDDRWHPEKVARQLDAFDRLDDSYGIIYTGGVVKRGKRIINRYQPSSERQGDIYPEVLAGFDLQPYSGHMIKRACFERVGRYDTDLGCAEDWDHAIRLAREYAFGAIADPLVERTFHDENASRDRRYTHGVETIPWRLADGTGPYGRIWDKHSEVITEYPAVERRFRARREVACARTELDAGNRRKALGHGLRALRYRPTPNAVLVLWLACLGPRALDGARRVRNAWIERTTADRTPGAGSPSPPTVGANLTGMTREYRSVEGPTTRSNPGRPVRLSEPEEP